MYKVLRSGLSAKALGIVPSGAWPYGATGIVPTTRSLVMSTMLTESEWALAT